MRWLSLMLSVMTGVAALHGAEADRGRQVVIVYNENEPESKLLATYYAAKRGVPANQVCGIGVRNAETITRREFNDQVRDPIRQFLTRTGLLVQEPQMLPGQRPSIRTVASKISYVVLMYGVPLRIDSDPTVVESAIPTNAPTQLRRNEAAVDSELALLPEFGLPVSGPLRNPFFDGIAPEFAAPLNQHMLLVGRLDGPDAATVRRMIDDALTAERNGLHGRAYFDARGIQDKGYKQGDEWIKNSYKLWQRAGYECALDEREELFGPEYPMTDAAVYAGWYFDHMVGPFTRAGFQFKPGALAYHIHSSSAATLHSTVAGWCGPLLAKGAAATLGNVYEPYLHMTPRVDRFFRRLLNGATFLEAAYASEPVLSWQTTFIGDPLYRPFAASLDEQIARLEAAHSPDLAWAYVRRVNLLLAREQTAAAEQLCRAKAGELGSVVLYEKLGDMLQAAPRWPGAIEAYNHAMHDQTDSVRYIRVATKLAEAYAANKQPALALAVYEGLVAAFPSHANAIGFYRKALELAGTIGDAAKSQSLRAKIESLTATPKK